MPRHVIIMLTVPFLFETTRHDTKHVSQSFSWKTSSKCLLISKITLFYWLINILLLLIVLLILSPERRSHSCMVASNSARVEAGDRFITESEIHINKIIKLCSEINCNQYWKRCLISIGTLMLKRDEIMLSVLES